MLLASCGRRRNGNAREQTVILLTLVTAYRLSRTGLFNFLFHFILFSDTSISTTAELTSKYHFAAHMGQLIAGVDGNGCHNFYPTCPFPGLQVLQIMKKVRMR